MKKKKNEQQHKDFDRWVKSKSRRHHNTDGRYCVKLGFVKDEVTGIAKRFFRDRREGKLET